MISIIRRMVNSKIGLVLTFLVLGLAALAFAAGDISGGGGTFSLGGNNGTVAKVGSARLTANDLQSRTELVFDRQRQRSEEHTSELQSLMRISYAVFCLKKKKIKKDKTHIKRPPERYET